MSDSVSEKNNSGYFLDGQEISMTPRRGRPLKAKHHAPEWFPQQTKVDACTMYCVYGDFDKVSELTKVPANILRTWHQEPWWVEIQKRVYVEQNENLSSRINEVLDKSLIEIKDRLENGDMFFDRKAGEFRRKPVETKTLAILFDNLTTKRQLVRGEPTSISAKIGVEDRLEQLKESFEKFAKSRLIENGAVVQESITEYEEGNHAIEEGFEQESNFEQHQEGNESRETSEASSSNSTINSTQIKKEGEINGNLQKSSTNEKDSKETNEEVIIKNG
jgi:hypothetical protein